MRVEWNKEKAKANEAKHGIRFVDVEPVLSDPLGITVEDMSADGEHRFITFGADMFGRVLAVVYTWRDQDTVRVISARKATNREKKQYES
jgi:hypothetical protein